MTHPLDAQAAPAAAAMQFEVRDGSRRIACKVSDEALEAASNLTLPSTPVARRKSFDRFRTLIDAAARLKLQTLPAGFTGPVVVSPDDMRRVPPIAGLPRFGSVGRT